MAYTPEQPTGLVSLRKKINNQGLPSIDKPDGGYTPRQKTAMYCAQIVLDAGHSVLTNMNLPRNFGDKSLYDRMYGGEVLANSLRSTYEHGLTLGEQKSHQDRDLILVMSEINQKGPGRVTGQMVMKNLTEQVIQMANIKVRLPLEPRDLLKYKGVGLFSSASINNPNDIVELILPKPRGEINNFSLQLCLSNRDLTRNTVHLKGFYFRIVS